MSGTPERPSAGSAVGRPFPAGWPAAPPRFPASLHCACAYEGGSVPGPALHVGLRQQRADTQPRGAHTLAGTEREEGGIRGWNTDSSRGGDWGWGGARTWGRSPLGVGGRAFLGREEPRHRPRAGVLAGEQSLDSSPWAAGRRKPVSMWALQVLGERSNLAAVAAAQETSVPCPGQHYGRGDRPG